MNGTEVRTNEHTYGQTERRKLYTPWHKCWGYKNRHDNKQLVTQQSSITSRFQNSHYWSRLKKSQTLIRAAAQQNQQNDLCIQRRLRSAWAPAQSDQSLCYPHEETFGPLTTYSAHSEDPDQTGLMPRLI